jgi:hypothetical protein
MIPQGITSELRSSSGRGSPDFFLFFLVLSLYQAAWASGLYLLLQVKNLCSSNSSPDRHQP